MSCARHARATARRLPHRAARRLAGRVPPASRLNRAPFMAQRFPHRTYGCTAIFTQHTGRGARRARSAPRLPRHWVVSARPVTARLPHTSIARVYAGPCSCTMHYERLWSSSASAMSSVRRFSPPSATTDGGRSRTGRDRSPTFFVFCRLSH